MKVGVIDIGTNTVLLLIAGHDTAGRLETIVDLQRTPRLGQGVDARRVLDQGSISRVLVVLKEYRTILEQTGVGKTIVAATSAVRDAANKENFREEVRKQTGYDIEILSGEDEAGWTFRGAISGLPQVRHATVIDIGGGSTEITSGTSQGIGQATSLDIGAVRLTERFLGHQPPDKESVARMESWLSGQLGILSKPGGETEIIGVAGTATSLASLDLGLTTFDRAADAGHRLTRDTIEQIYRELWRRTPEEIRGMSAVLEGREDIITAGTAILLGIMRHFGATSLIVSERGIRYGLALRELTGPL